MQIKTTCMCSRICCSRQKLLQQLVRHLTAAPRSCPCTRTYCCPWLLANQALCQISSSFPRISMCTFQVHLHFPPFLTLFTTSPPITWIFHQTLMPLAGSVMKCMGSVQMMSKNTLRQRRYHSKQQSMKKVMMQPAVRTSWRSFSQRSSTSCYHSWQRCVLW